MPGFGIGFGFGANHARRGIIPSAPTIAFAIPAVSVAEGNSGTTTVGNTINVTRNGVTGPLVVNLTYSGTATSGSDYVAGPSAVTIADAANSASFDLQISGDATVEPDETIIVGATLAAYPSAVAAKTITITNDDVVTFGPYSGPTIAAYTGPVANRTYAPTAVTSSAGVEGVTVAVAAQDLTVAPRLTYVGWYVSQSDGTVNNSSAYTVKASIEYNGVIVPITFGASRNGSVTPGSSVQSDAGTALGFTIPAGAKFLIHYLMTSASGGVPYTAADAAGGGPFWTAQGERCNAGATPPDLVDTPGTGGTVGNAATANCYPVAIEGSTTRPTFVIDGNSRAFGTQDTPDANGAVGEVEASLAKAGYAFVNVAVSGDRAVWKTRYGRPQRLPILRKGTHIVINGPINDTRAVRGNTSASRVSAEMINLAKLLPGRALIAVTSAPAPTAATTADTADAARMAVNTALLANPAPFVGSVDLATLFDANNDGLWDDAADTADLTHQSAAAGKGYRRIVGSGLIAPNALAALAPGPALFNVSSLIGDTNKAVIVDARDAACTGSQDLAIFINRTSGDRIGSVSQTTPPRPALTASQFGSNPGVVFTGTQELQVGTGKRDVVNGGSALFIMALFKLGAVPSATSPIVHNSTDASGTAIRVTMSVTATGLVRLVAKRLNSDSNVVFDSTTALVAGNSYFVCGYVDVSNGAASIRINGATDVATTNAPDAGAAAALTFTGGYGTWPANNSSMSVLGSLSSGSYLSETLAYLHQINGQRTLTEIQKSEGIVAYEWGQQALLPAGHPYKSAAPAA